MTEGETGRAEPLFVVGPDVPEIERLVAALGSAGVRIGRGRWRPRPFDAVGQRYGAALTEQGGGADYEPGTIDAALRARIAEAMELAAKAYLEAETLAGSWAAGSCHLLPFVPFLDAAFPRMRLLVAMPEAPDPAVSRAAAFAARLLGNRCQAIRCRLISGNLSGAVEAVLKHWPDLQAPARGGSPSDTAPDRVTPYDAVLERHLARPLPSDLSLERYRKWTDLIEPALQAAAATDVVDPGPGIVLVVPTAGGSDRVPEFLRDLAGQPGSRSVTVLTDLAPEIELSWPGRVVRTARPAGTGWSERLAGLLAQADGDWLFLVEPTARLAASFLAILQTTIGRRPEAQLLHGDFDFLADDGSRQQPVMKPPCWDEDLALQSNLLRGWIAVRRSLLDPSCLPVPAPAATLYAIGLSASAHAPDASIVHLPHVLAHLPVPSPEAEPVVAAACAQVREHALARRSPGAVLEPGSSETSQHVRYPLPEPAPKVSVIVPTRDGGKLLARCIDGVRTETDYGPLEIIVVDNGSRDPETLGYLAGLADDPRCRVIRHDQPFNFAEIVNLAAARATGSLLCLLNDDIRVLHRSWLTEMVGLALRPDVGIVGPLLLFENGTVQHAGVTLGLLGHVAGHDFHYLPESQLRRHERYGQVHQTSAVTAACAVLRRDVFERVGGMDAEHLAVNYNDLDLCLKIGDSGLKVLWTPYARLIHAESVTRGKEERARRFALGNAEGGFIASKWPTVSRPDRFLNGNLSVETTGFELNFVLSTAQDSPDAGDRPDRQRLFEAAREIARTADILPDVPAFHAAKAAHHLKMDGLAARLTLEAVVQVPEAYTANLVAGTCSAKVGDLRRARSFFRFANLISPQAVRPWLYRGLLAEQLGDADEAIELLSTALTHDPFNRRAQAALQRLSPADER